ncbi:MAG: hypothetical protein MUO76_20525, partial [Anaerolineaceae bacterium]|nr:hypothetical protein [Anaerolineaceae bacterium]
MKSSSTKKIITAFFFFVWMLIVVAIYFWGHKPLTIPVFTAIFNSLRDVLLVFLVTALAGGIGRWFIPANKLASLERIALHASFGFGVLGLLWFLAGLLSLYKGWAAWGVLIAGMVIFRQFSWDWIKDFLVLREIWSVSGKLEKSLLLIAILLVLGQLFFVLSPPIKYDALTYHLELPRRYIENGKFNFITNNPYWGHPQLTEMLYTWMMILVRPQTAAVLGWGFGVLTLIGVLGVASSRFGTANQPEKENKVRVTAGCMAVITLLA